jgi:hypothetical protein
MLGNTGTSWEDDFGDPLIHNMVDLAREHYKAEKDQSSQASLHTIAYILALGELRSWRIADRLERIAQALETHLRGETITMWQVLDLLHNWTRDWERERVKIPSGEMISVDIIEVSYIRSSDQWKGAVFSNTTKEVFNLDFRLDENFQIQMLSIEKVQD